jgi:hypothetical protein
MQFNFKYINEQVNNHMNIIVSEEIILNGIKWGIVDRIFMKDFE